MEMNDLTWEAIGRQFVVALATEVGAKLDELPLNDQLIQFTLLPESNSAATIGLIISPDEVILSAGSGTRFELDGLPASTEEVRRIVRAIAGGGLWEQIRPRKVKFALRFADGSSERGQSWFAFDSPTDARAEIQYASYNEAD